MRGRKPTPAALHELHGNPGKRRRAEPRVSPGRGMQPPAHVKANADAFAEWRRITSVFGAIGIVTQADRGTLAACCKLYADWIEAEAKMAATGGAVIEGRNGGLVRNPWSMIRNRCLELYLKTASEFGLTPSSRARVGLVGAVPPNPDDAPESDFDRFLANRPGSLHESEH